MVVIFKPKSKLEFETCRLLSVWRVFITSSTTEKDRNLILTVCHVFDIDLENKKKNQDLKTKMI